MEIMARKNGSQRLDAAMAQLVENQAALVAQHTLFLSQMANFLSQMAKLQQDFEEIRALLLHHQRILQELPEAIKRTIGFKGR